MDRRRLLGCLAAAVFAVCACKDKTDNKAAPKAPPTAAELEARCDQLATSCGDTPKHVAKIVEECKLAAKAQVEKSCTDRAVAVYDCYSKELCGKTDKIWSYDDLRVLAERKNACSVERTALTTCMGK